ncbi:MAG: GGDEF domain-containing protein [Deltaproteobacteria bacterium]|jgi:diguanylate cyclase (GGDEF)-like protein|nr:GGDEF domain-containing protein [Deltaproteobacteria bacterium]
MAEQNNVAELILSAMDVAVLMRCADGAYKVLGAPPLFYDRIFPAVDEEHCTAPWRCSQMLDFFYTSAEEFFVADKCGVLSSGYWEEEGLCEEGQAFVAEAMVLQDAKVITVRLLTNTFSKQAAILRKAREQLLERRFITNSLELYKRKALVDGLTKVLNRTAFMDILSKEVGRSNANYAPFSVVMLDIDDFKGVNDTYGHQSGDMVLENLAKILREKLRREDIIGRYGGEEFIAMLPHTSPKQVARIAEKLRKSVEDYAFESLPTITVSLGCTSFNRNDSLTEIVKRADEALYDSKHGGKNMVSLR